jgi:P-type Cu2+ transporter
MDHNHSTHNHESFNKHAGHSLEMFARKFWVSLILTIPVVLYSELPQKFFGFTTPLSVYGSSVSLFFSSIVFFYGGWIFVSGAARELKERLPGMMTLITLAISTAYLYSVAVTILGREGALFWELTTLITVMLLGHWLEMRAVQSTQSALKELSKLLPDTAEIMRGEKTEIIKIEKLKVGDVILVRPGGKIAADGAVVSGKSDVNESLATGESKPVEKNPGDEVIAGTINGDGSLHVKVTKIGENTFLAGVMRLVAEAQASKSKLQILSDRAAFYLTIIAITTGGITFLLWLVARAGFGFAIERLVTVLVIACPHALGLAVPLVASISTALAARKGFLVKQRLALESARNVNIVLFDKTGTLTSGEFGVTDIVESSCLPMPGTGGQAKLKVESEEEILRLAASVDNQAEHFIAKAIVKEALKRNLNLLPVENFQALKGKGVRGIMGDKEVLAGGDILLRELNISLEDDFKAACDSLARVGKTVIYVIYEKNLIGAIALADIIRGESREAIKELKKMNVKIAMITGDSEETAKWVAGELNIDEYFARVLPEEKANKVKLLQEKGFKTAFVGDGINDAPALAQADLGIAIGAGTNVAIESAGIILVRNDPRDIVKIIKLSKATYKKMIQNLFWATGYNVVAIPLAAGVLAGKGILLQPALGALFMSLSTVIVAINALLLRKVKL